MKSQSELNGKDQTSVQQPTLKWLNRTVVGVAIASFFSDVGHEIATSAMPAFLATLGISSATLGLIEGLADGLSSFAKLLSGIYSDRLESRKLLAVIGYFVTASGMASFAFATQSWHVLLGRVSGWSGRGVRTPVRNILLTESTTPATYGRAFGFERSMDSAGAVVGPILSLILVANLGYRVTFLWTLVPGLAAAFCIWFLVKEKPHQRRPPSNFRNHIRELPGNFREYLVGVGIAGLGDFSNTLLILWATQAFTPQYGARAPLTAIILYTGYNVVYTASCSFAGFCADRFPKPNVLACGYLMAIVPAILLVSAGTSLAQFSLIFAISGLYMGFWETLESSTAAEMLPCQARGTGFGILATVNGIGDLVSSIVVGFLWMLAPSAAMGFVILTTLVGALVIYRSGHRQKL